MRNTLHRQIAHLVGKLAHLLWYALKKLLIVDHVLGAADNKNGNEILLVTVGVVPVILDYADLRKLVEKLFHPFDLPAELACDLSRSVGLAHLHLQHQLRHLVGQDLVEHPVFWTRFIHFRLTECNIHTIGNMLCQFYYQFSHMPAPFLML